MDASPFYRPVDSRLCQGDILERVPNVYVKNQPVALKRITLSGGRAGYEIDESQEPSKEDALIPALCHISRGILLTHGCEIDKDAKHRLIALVRPVRPEWEAEQLAIVRENRNYSYFYLPASEGKLSESYVDLRRICTVSPHWVDSAIRLASLTAEACQAMLFQLVRFLTRAELDPKIFGGQAD
jgi:hypothetical protein